MARNKKVIGKHNARREEGTLVDLSAVTEQNNPPKESLSTEKVDKTTELLDIAALDVALYTLANYGLVLFAQWQKAVEGWSADNPDRQRLRHVVEQILVPFWTHHGEALTVGLSQKTVQGLQGVRCRWRFHLRAWSSKSSLQRL